MVVFACKRKLIISRLTDGLKIVNFYLALKQTRKSTGKVEMVKNEYN